jgi:DNA-binding CsgD family transcriptional regulator
VERRGVVGRKTELAEVAAFLGAAGERFAALALEGEAGIGKTTVWESGRVCAQERGARVLSCRASRAEAKLSLSGLTDMLEGVPDTAFGELPAPQRSALEVAMLRAPPGERPPAPRAVAAGFLTLVRELAGAQPVVLAIDDAQWLDRPSRGVVEYAARRLDQEPVGLLYSLRTPAASPAFADVLAEGRLTRVTLGALSLAAIGRIASATLRTPLPRPLVVRIVNATAGNPFYALEIARLTVEQEAEHGPGSTLPVPDDMQMLTAARVRRLPAPTNSALLLAALLAAPDTRAIDASAVEPAELSGIVKVDTRGAVAFTHPLLASAVYLSASDARRREAHRRAAALVQDPEQRARHLALSGRRRGRDLSERLENAAAIAASRGALEAAAELAELAARRTPVSERSDESARLLSAARFCFEAGDLNRSDRLAQEALDGSPAAVRARALQLQAQLRCRRSDFTKAAELGAAALEAVGDDHELRSALELDVAFYVGNAGDLPRAETLAVAAIAHAEEAANDGALAEALAVLTMIGFLGGRGRDEARLRRALALEDPLREGALTMAMRPSFVHGLLQLWTGDTGGALGTLGALIDETQQRGQEATKPMLSLYLVWAHIWLGDLHSAARCAEEGCESAGLLEDPAAAANTLAARALVNAHAGHTDLARAEAAESFGLIERLQWRSVLFWPLWALGVAELSEGRPVEADRALAPLAEAVTAMGMGDPALCVPLTDEVEACVAIGETERALSYLEPFERRAEELDRAWAIAAAARCRGAICAARQEPDLAFSHFERAMAAHARVSMPFERARTLLLAGQARRRYKQRARAREALREAFDLFGRVGAARWAARARAELERLGGPSADGQALTHTERRVAELVAQGLSNREVAERAFIAPKTVEANLTRVYRKLGVRSRVELANRLRSETAVR